MFANIAKPITLRPSFPKLPEFTPQRKVAFIMGAIINVFYYFVISAKYDDISRVGLAILCTWYGLISMYLVMLTLRITVGKWIVRWSNLGIFLLFIAFYIPTDLLSCFFSSIFLLERFGRVQMDNLYIYVGMGILGAICALIIPALWTYSPQRGNTA